MEHCRLQKMDRTFWESIRTEDDFAVQQTEINDMQTPETCLTGEQFKHVILFIIRLKIPLTNRAYSKHEVSRSSTSHTDLWLVHLIGFKKYL